MRGRGLRRLNSYTNGSRIGLAQDMNDRLVWYLHPIPYTLYPDLG